MRTRRGLAVCSIALGVLSAVTACGGDDSNTPAAPATNDGTALYAAHCASCHGEDLRGTDKGPSHLSIVYEPNHHPDESFRQAVKNGVPAHHWDFGDMPPVAGLSDEQIDAVIAHVRRVQEREGFENG